MYHHRSMKRTSSAQRNDPEKEINAAIALLNEAVEHLAQKCPPPLLVAAARESLEDLEPHVHEALEALGHIERGRNLTDQELARRRAFRMLLARVR
jgi:hypothetical protein